MPDLFFSSSIVAAMASLLCWRASRSVAAFSANIVCTAGLTSHVDTSFGGCLIDRFKPSDQLEGGHDIGQLLAALGRAQCPVIAGDVAARYFLEALGQDVSGDPARMTGLVGAVHQGVGA